MIHLAQLSPALKATQTEANALLESLQKTFAREDVGFYRFTENSQHVGPAIETAKKFQDRSHFVHVGIGGSALGPEMLMAALGLSSNKKIQFINNIDSSMLARQQQEWSVQNSVFFIVSKSGSTPETLATLAIILDWLKTHHIPQSQWKDHLVFCTDPQKGELKRLGQQWGVTCLTVPTAIGGRFSVLTDVGLFPAAWAGLPVKELFEGAETLKNSLTKQELSSNPLIQLALWIHQTKRPLTVLMPYSSLLKEFTSWWVQLWAESLGKEGRGLTPLMAYGATDQHAQVQLFMEGPDDKSYLFLEVEKATKAFSLKEAHYFESLPELRHHNLSGLMQAELLGTQKALQEKNRPMATLQVKEVDAKNLGALVLFFECLTVALGQLINVDPFNQPGVEAGKIFAKEWLKTHAQA